MGGKSTSTTTQSSTTAPWAPAQPALTGILDQLNGLVQNSGLSQTSQDAISQLQQSAQAGNPYADQISGLVSNLMNGGGATATAPAVQGAYDAFKAQTSPLASNTDYNPYNTPGFSDALKTAMGDISNQINSQFAAAGRDLSGMNTQTLARGLSQGAASTIANQYNQNVANQQGAASNLYNAGNSTAGLLAGLNQQSLANQLQGVASSNDALAAQNYTATQMLNLEQLKQQLPAQTLGLLTQIGVPIAGLGSQSQGTSTTENQMSGAQQFGTIAGGLGNIGKFLWG